MTCQFYLYHYCQALARASIDTAPLGVDYAAYKIQELCTSWATYFRPKVLCNQWSSCFDSTYTAWEEVLDTSDMLELLFARCADLRKFYLHLNIPAYNRRLVELKGTLREVIIPDMFKRGYNDVSKAQVCAWGNNKSFIMSYAPFACSNVVNRLVATYSDAERTVADAYLRTVSRAPSITHKQPASCIGDTGSEWVTVQSVLQEDTVPSITKALMEGEAMHPEVYEDLMRHCLDWAVSDGRARVLRTEMIG